MPQKPVRVFLIRKNIALAAGALLAAVAIFCAVNVPAAITAAGSARQLPIYCVDRSGEDGKKILLHFLRRSVGQRRHPDAH